MTIGYGRVTYGSETLEGYLSTEHDQMAGVMNEIGGMLPRQSSEFLENTWACTTSLPMLVLKG